MKKLIKPLIAAIIMGAFFVGLSGCEGNEGPIEKAGKEMDQATQKLGEKIEAAGENIQDAAKGNE
ncbi:MAG: hypothetical protein KBT50_00355 [Cycloclasticus sp.]|nr:hypothetical protein [Cycloclasticus sp.]MBQ0789041.1 hypothetical protein [Cycloclasticus sp.]